MTVEKGAFEGTPVIADGVVYVGDLDGKLYALQPGRRQGDVDVTRSRAASSPRRRSAASLLYVGDIDGKFYCFDAKTGQAEVDVRRPRPRSTPGANFCKDNVLFGSQDANAVLPERRAAASWSGSSRFGDQIRCTPTVVGDRSFVAGCDSKLHIIDLTTGKEVGERADRGADRRDAGRAGRPRLSSAPRGARSSRVNWKEAKVVWKVEDKSSSQPYRSSPAVQDGIVVVGSRDRRVHAFDPDDRQ